MGKNRVLVKKSSKASGRAGARISKSNPRSFIVSSQGNNPSKETKKNLGTSLEEERKPIETPVVEISSEELDEQAIEAAIAVEKENLLWAFIPLTVGLLAFFFVSLVLYLKPFSGFYSLQIEQTDFRLHQGDQAEVSYTFVTESTDAFQLWLQEMKLSQLEVTSLEKSVLEVTAFFEEPGSSLKGSFSFEAVGEGSGTIEVTLEDLTQVIQVESFVPASEIGFSKKEYTLICGQKLNAETLVLPDNAVLFDSFLYSSSDDTIVTIDAQGQLVAGLPGETTITVQADGLINTAVVKVIQPLQSISFHGVEPEETISIERDASLDFSIDFYPENTTDSREVRFELSDPDMGVIDKKGHFTAKKIGSYTIKAICGKTSAILPVEITAALQRIELNHQEKSLVYPASDTLSFTLFPADTTEELVVSWNSSDTGVVRVDENGHVTISGGGTADVVLNVNGMEAKCTYSVSVPVVGVNISAGSIFLYTGHQQGLAAAVVPSFTTENPWIHWSSDDSSVATVDGAGVVTAIAPGTTVIRANHGGYQAACQVQVANMPTAEERADSIIAYGKQFLGTRYVYGGTSLTGGIDCSSFTQQCFATQVIGLNRVSYGQVNQGSGVSLDPSAWKKGDLLFYSPNGYVSHVAIYIGDGQILHSSQSQGGVVITAYNYFGMGPSHVRRFF